MVKAFGSVSGNTMESKYAGDDLGPQVIDQRSAIAEASANTASSIGSVNLPVKVFCWLGWKQPSSS
jgi:hypothetical protein